MTTVCATYPICQDHACHIAAEVALSPFSFFIEPSPITGYLFDDLSTATAFRLRFDAECWPSEDDGVHLMCAPYDPELAPWLAGCGSDYRQIEFVVIQFGSSKDCERFQGALCRGPSAASVE